MKTWEMIKALTENPEKKFRSGKGKNEMIAERVNQNIQLKYIDRDIEANSVSVTRTWEEVKEPVTFMEAVKALDKDKTIYALHGEDYEYKETFSPKGNKVDGGVALYQDQNYAVWTDLILYGKWYIED